MKSRNIADMFKNAVGTVFLLAGAFFVCSTLLSMRAVFADPIVDEPVVSTSVTQSPRNTTPARKSPRTQAVSKASTARAATSRTAANSRAVTSRKIISRGDATNSRAATTARGVVSRTVANSRTTPARSVVARTGTSARVSLQGSAIRGSKATTSTSTYTYLSNKLYTGSYSNIIDSTTGLISADAYANCMESYYTCMDEICTARSAAKRRCSCAARVTNFMEAEEALKAANEELIKVSGELALLLATKGKDVSEAFQLTDAEKVMNCVSWQETTQRYGTNSSEAVDWCNAHNIYNSTSSCPAPSYCAKSGNTRGT